MSCANGLQGSLPRKGHRKGHRQGAPGCIGRRLFSSKRADIPLAMMALQIGLIIAAGVIMGSLIQHAKKGTEATSMDRSDILSYSKNTVEITGIEGKSDGSREIKTLLITVEPGTVSEPIKLEDLTLIIGQDNVTSLLKFRNGSLERNVSSGYYTE